MRRTIFGLSLLCVSAIANSAPFALQDSIRCSLGNSVDIAIADVTGNNGGSDDCWGVYNGNDPGPSGDGFVIDSADGLDGHQFDFVSKWETEGTEGEDIGLMADLNDISGDWSFDEGALGGSDFLLVLKAASDPGYGVWLFSGDSADSFSGTFNIAWNQGLSHIAIYSKEGGEMPAPATPLLLLGGLLVLLRRRR